MTRKINHEALFFQVNHKAKIKSFRKGKGDINSGKILDTRIREKFLKNMYILNSWTFLDKMSNNYNKPKHANHRNKPYYRSHQNHI